MKLESVLCKPTLSIRIVVSSSVKKFLVKLSFLDEKRFFSFRHTVGAVTLSIMTASKMTPSIMTFSTTILGMMTFNLMKLNMKILIIMTLSMKIFSITSVTAE